MDHAVSNTSLNVDTSDPEVAGRFGYGTLESVVGTLRGFLGATRYVCGTHFTAADVMLGSVINWGMMFKTIPDHPELRTYVDRVTSRPAYLRAQEIDNALMNPPEG